MISLASDSIHKTAWRQRSLRYINASICLFIISIIINIYY